MKNPAIVIPDAMQVLQALSAAIEKGGIPPRRSASSIFEQAR